MRIDLIDNFRALAMIYVLFIHCLFYPAIFFQDIKSLFLIEMPLFFAITGMSHYFAHTEDTKKFLLSRLSRILIPYWIYSIVCITLNVLHTNTSNIWEIIISWINPFSEHISTILYLNWATWFISIYLLVCLIIPVLKRIFINTNGITKLMPVIILLLLNACFSVGLLEFYELQLALFYALWVYMGFWYISTLNDKSIKEKFLPCLIISLLGGGVCFVIYPYFSLDMQINKFPPNVLFMSYCMIFIPIIFLFSQQINHILNCMCRFKPWNWIFQQYKKYCYTIYLYHSLSFLIVYFLTNLAGLETFFKTYEHLGLLIYWLAVTIISAEFGRLFGKCERIKIN